MSVGTFMYMFVLYYFIPLWLGSIVLVHVPCMYCALFIFYTYHLIRMDFIGKYRLSIKTWNSKRNFDVNHKFPMKYKFRNYITTL